MKALLLIVWLLFLVAGCAQKQIVVPVSAAVEGAQRLERRAATAYSKGDLLGAQKDYQTAQAVYVSLALEEPLSSVQLNLAKLEGEMGRTAQGLALVEAVLRKTNLNAASRLMAHGRAAALAMAEQKRDAVEQHLNAADALCAPRCEAASALAALRAGSLLARADLPMARRFSDIALGLAQTTADKANALRSRASVGLAEGGTALTQAKLDAEQALGLDQTLGASLRVIADLQLLAQLSDKAGLSAKAVEYAALERAARAAREQLRLK